MKVLSQLAHISVMFTSRVRCGAGLDADEGKPLVVVPQVESVVRAIDKRHPFMTRTRPWM